MTKWERRTVTRTRQPRLRRLIAATLAAVLGGCTGAPAEPAETPATGTTPSVEFSADIEVKGQSLHITYHLINQSGEDLIVLDQVPTYTVAGTVTQDVNAVYITGRPDSGQVEIAKRAFAMPETDRKTWARAARVSGIVVAAGQPVGEELTVPLALRRHHPYGDDIGYGTIKLPDPVTAAVFCVGVVRKGQVQPPPTGTSVTLPHLSSTTAVQHLFCSGAVRL